ncbi:DUF4282 domain-containing protein [Pseudoalteromonas sp. SWXJZ94C]|uniref:DUF4282 domain-containing protein n=1 Tax=Pseudoalteromonas sp. SWXJZ94C TaxID=2792065 RepID=UPI0018CD782B|nr:DUF4282 domain-containing protein [Pseudoalteromonas sp. SWXJZ94C]MBH0056109.1 DUF4282 domain-containing protein [Pseudoalteromonas sp. SWXJZ94C]
MKDLFFFDSMITPKIITFIYWLILLATLVSGITAMFTSYGGGFISGIGIIVFGAIGARVWCEFVIVLFKINSNLQKIADKED